MDPRGPDMRAPNADPMRLLDPREQMRQMGGGGDMRGDPRGKMIILVLPFCTFLMY